MFEGQVCDSPLPQHSDQGRSEGRTRVVAVNWTPFSAISQAWGHLCRTRACEIGMPGGAMANPRPTFTMVGVHVSRIPECERSPPPAPQIQALRTQGPGTTGSTYDDQGQLAERGDDVASVAPQSAHLFRVDGHCDGCRFLSYSDLIDAGPASISTATPGHSPHHANSLFAHVPQNTDDGTCLRHTSTSRTARANPPRWAHRPRSRLHRYLRSTVPHAPPPATTST